MSCASVARQPHPMLYGRTLGVFGVGSCGYACWGVCECSDCAECGSGAACRAVGLYTLLAGGASFDSRPCMLGDLCTDRSCGWGDKHDSRGQRWRDAAESCAIGGCG